MEPTDLVTRADLERHLDALEAADPEAGLFGPGSMMWTVGRESVLLMAGGRAALLQVAHPYVAHAVAAHSKVFTDVQLRFRRTLSYVYAMTFGSLRQARALARKIHRVHTRIEGTIDEDLGRYRAGDRYRANEPHALFWVAATLWDTSIDIFQRTVRPLTDDELERYYAEARVFCRLFGIPREAMPRDWRAFRRYMAAMFASSTLAVGHAAREIADSIFTPPRPAARPMYACIRALTTGLMPPRFRYELGLPYGPIERAASAASLRALRMSLPRLPDSVRYTPTYLRAQRRLHGRRGPDPVADAMRRLSLALLKNDRERAA